MNHAHLHQLPAAPTSTEVLIGLVLVLSVAIALAFICLAWLSDRTEDTEFGQRNLEKRLDELEYKQRQTARCLDEMMAETAEIPMAQELDPLDDADWWKHGIKPKD